MTNDPRVILAREPMGRMQILAVVICVLLNGFDGFDVLSISFASPGIAAEWGIDRAALGIVLAMELIGMAFGSIILGNIADRIGRRPTILGCLTVMATGMFLATTAGSVSELLLYRLLTGFGIGGMLAAINAVVAEFANARRRNLSVALMAGGYPVGAVVGGAVASKLLAGGDWRLVFMFGAVATGAFIPVVWLLLPETVGYLMQNRPARALARVNATLKRMGHGAIEHLPKAGSEPPRSSMGQLFSPKLMRTTLLLTVAYFTHIMTFYFILKWIPKIVVDMGFAASAAGGVLVWANVGGASGAIILSLLTQRIGVRPLVIGALLLSAFMVALFGQIEANLAEISLVAGIAGFCTNGAVVGLYAIFAQCFPTAVRAGGTGFVIGIGRGGAALGPIIVGFLFSAGFSLPVVALCMAAGSLVAAAALLFIPYKEQTDDTRPAVDQPIVPVA
jgi:benzoate transport